MTQGTVHRVDVHPVLTAWGLASWERTGKVHDLTDGQVVLAGDGNGATSLDGWHASRAEALLAAAAKAEALVAPVLEQIRRLRQEATA